MDLITNFTCPLSFQTLNDLIVVAGLVHHCALSLRVDCQRKINKKYQIIVPPKTQKRDRSTKRHIKPNISGVVALQTLTDMIFFTQVEV